MLCLYYCIHVNLWQIDPVHTLLLKLFLYIKDYLEIKTSIIDGGSDSYPENYWLDDEIPSQHGPFSGDMSILGMVCNFGGMFVIFSAKS